MNNKYWLRCGVWLTIIYVIFFTTFLIYLNAAEPSATGRGLGMIILVLVNIPTSLLLEPLVQALPAQTDGMLMTGILLLLAGIIQWFVVGAFVGWLYGKVKNRNVA